MNKVPVTIVTGFLGAGKTSLLNHLTQSYSDKKFAIIENEFGEKSIDSELINTNEDKNIIELNNGCICCNLNNELYIVLKKLIDSNLEFNHLLIETTGIADPGSVLVPFVIDPFVKQRFEIDSLICIADAKHVLKDLTREEISIKQIAISDLILLNKTDLVTTEELEKTTAEIARINPFATIRKSIHSRPENFKILDVYSYDVTKAYQFVLQAKSVVNKETRKSTVHQIENMLYSTNQPMDQLKLSMWLEAFLNFNQDTIYRIKGIVHLADVENRIVLQSVHTQIKASVGKAWGKNEIRESKIVIIGKQLNRDVIRKNLDEILIPSPETA